MFPRSFPAVRQPASQRRYVKPSQFPLHGLKEIPDGLSIACFFPEDLSSEDLQVGDYFTLAVDAPTPSGSFGSTTSITKFSSDTLIEFKVTKRVAATPQACAYIEFRATYILIPGRNDPDTDIAIPVATASVLAPDNDLVNVSRWESARVGDEFGAALGMLFTNSSHNYFLVGAAGKLLGYANGRNKENAAGINYLAGKIEKGTECVVRINRRIVF